MSAEIMRQFIDGLDIPDGDKQRLLAMTPASYTGIADRLVDAIR